MKSLLTFLLLIRDAFILPYLPSILIRRIVGTYDYAFLIHPRYYSDYIRQYPIAKFIPEGLFKRVISFVGPILVSTIEGVVDKDGNKKTGLLISVLMTSDVLVLKKEKSRLKILQAVKLSSKLGVKILGLGALTASVTERGKYLAGRSNVGITTGHAFTSIVVLRNFLRISKVLKTDNSYVTVAIVGAAGSVGNICTRLLIKQGVRKFILIDKKINLLHEQISMFAHDIQTVSSSDINKIYDADYVITATNAPYALVKSEMIQPGTVILDDAQPTDIDPTLEKRDDILVINAGICRLPNLNPHFNFGLLFQDDVFGCLGETIALSWDNWSSDYVIDYVQDHQIEKMVDLYGRVGFTDSELRGFNRVYEEEDLLRIRNIRLSGR